MATAPLLSLFTLPQLAYLCRPFASLNFSEQTRRFCHQMEQLKQANEKLGAMRYTKRTAR